MIKKREAWNKGKSHSKETKQKISESNKGKCLSNEHKEKISSYMKNRTVSVETRKKMSEAKKGKTAWNKGLKCSNETKKKISLANTGRKTSIKTKKKLSSILKGHYVSEETKHKIRESNKGIPSHKKYTISKLKKTYPLFFKIEEIRYNPDKPGEKEIQVRCKNHNCPNSKEKDGWFTPTSDQIYLRASSLKLDNDNSYFYCCDKCKEECPLYNKRVASIIKMDQIKAGIINELYYTQEEYNIWRNEVLRRADYKCEYCGEQAEHAHHSRPQKLEPFFSLDPDYGIACCINCHYKNGHKDECSTGQLANKICKH